MVNTSLSITFFYFVHAGDIYDPTTFLTKIGRSSASVAEKFKSWEHLFTASPAEMKTDMALSVKQRRWILNWTEKYR